MSAIVLDSSQLTAAIRSTLVGQHRSRFVTKFQAHKKAHELWGMPGHAPGDRYGFTCLRHKKVDKRCEVGYCERIDDHHANTIVMGRGATWEEAFADAEHAPDDGHADPGTIDWDGGTEIRNARAAKDTGK